MKKTWKTPLIAGLMITSLVNTTFAETLTHKGGDLLVAGDFAFSKEGVSDNYEGLSPGEYGYFFLEDIMNFETMQPFAIKTRELHYYITSNDDVTVKSKSAGIGIRPIPVMNGAYTDLANAKTGFTAENADGDSVEIKGSELMDNHLRKAFGYKGQDLQDGPIFAYMSYIHPEKSKTRLKFSSVGEPSNLKSENGITHLGAYIGNGSTRNSPASYHSKTWGHKSGRLSYPATMYVLKYTGAASQKVFNRNGIIALRTLNELNGGPVFPPDYKFDKFKTVSLEKNLDFYRAWIDKSWKKNASDTQSVYEMMTSTQAEWDTYCAEHLTIALNVALNVEHNEVSFKKIWGDAEGADLWKKLQKRWANDLNDSFTEIDDNDYEMLWEMHKVKNPTKKAGVGKAMAWKPETTADLVSDFVRQYVPFYRVGAMNSSLVVIGFAKEFHKRMGMDPKMFGGLAAPIISSMFKYEMAVQMANKGLSALPNSEDIVAAMGGKYLQGIKQLVQAKPEMAAAAPMLEGAINMIIKNPAQIADVAAKAKDYATIPMNDRRGVKANDDFIQEAHKAFQKAVNANVASEDGVYRVKYYSPPAILRKIYLKLHDSADQLKVFPVATAVPVTDVEPKAVQADQAIDPAPAIAEEADASEAAAE